MINIVFLLDITGSMGSQLDGVKRTIAQLVKQVYEEDDARDVAITIITFTESRQGCFVTNDSFKDGDDAVTFVRSIKLCVPPGQPHIDASGGDGEENHKAALAELLRLDGNVPTIAFVITDAGPHLVADRLTAEATHELAYLKTQHSLTNTDMFHILSLVEAHFGSNLILNIIKYVEDSDHRLYGALAKQFHGVLITPRASTATQLANGLMAILTKLFESFMGVVSVLEDDIESQAALDAFTFFNVDALATLPTREADVQQLPSPAMGSTTDAMYALIDRACVIVGTTFAKRALHATGLHEQIELLLVAAKSVTNTMALDTAVERATTLLEKIRALVPPEHQGHIKIHASDLPTLLRPRAAATASSSIDAAMSAITLMNTEETVLSSLGSGAVDSEASAEQPPPTDDPAAVLQLAASLFLGHLAVLELPLKNGKVDFMDAWSAVIHTVSNDVLSAADFLNMIGRDAATRGLSIRATAYNYVQLFADPRDSVGSALLEIASGTQVLDILTGLLAGAPLNKFAPHMFRGTIAASLETLVIGSFIHDEPPTLTSYEWAIVWKLKHSIQLLLGARPQTMLLDPEAAVAKQLFALVRLVQGEEVEKTAARGFLEEVLARMVQRLLKYREQAYWTLLQDMVAYTHVDASDDVSELHALDAPLFAFDPATAINRARASRLSQTFELCATNVLTMLFRSCEDADDDGKATTTIPTLTDVWPNWREELPKFILLGKRTARYDVRHSSSSDDDDDDATSSAAAGTKAVAKAPQVTWKRNDKLTLALSDALYQALAMQALRKQHDAFVRALHARRANEAAEVRWRRILQLLRSSFAEFVAALPTVVYSSSRLEHKLLLDAFKQKRDTLDVGDYEAKLQVVLTGRLVDGDSDTIVFNRGNLHPRPDAFVPMTDAFQTKLRALQQSRGWPIAHTYRPSDAPNHSGFSNSKPSEWARVRSLQPTTFWTSAAPYTHLSMWARKKQRLARAKAKATAASDAKA